MKILVLNSGSSSLEFQVLDMANQSVMVKGIVEKIGEKDSFLEYEVDGEKTHIDKKLSNHKEAITLVFNTCLTSHVSNLMSIQAIGHRVVHGGEYFSAATKIDDAVTEKIQLCSELAPLHNPANLAGILACQELAPETPQIAVFDTAFHQTMQPEHYLYAIPYSYYEKYKVRRYGFHGTSHQFVYEQLIQNPEFKTCLPVGKVQNPKVITCHIGNGASITAIQDGKVIETSMGMTPMEGLMMGTRAGNVDPGVITFLMKKEGLSAQDIENILNKKSGLLGVSETSSDMRDILDGRKEDDRATITLQMYINSIVKYIGSYVALMNGVDALVFTGSVLERSRDVRKLLLQKLARLGISLDEKVNDFSTEERVISTADSKVLVKVVPTNEELMVAEEAYRLLEAKS